MKKKSCFTVLFCCLGLWLLSSEAESNYISEKWRDLNFGIVDDSTKYVASAASSFFESVGEKSSSVFSFITDNLFDGIKAPCLYILEALRTAFSSVSDFLINLSDFLLNNIYNFFSLASEFISYLWIVASDFLSRFLNGFSDGVKSAIIYIYEFFLNLFFNLKEWTVSVFMNFWDLVVVVSEGFKSSILYLVSFYPVASDGYERAEFKVRSDGSEITRQELFEQHKAIAKLSEELKDFRVLSGDLEALKKRIDDLEAEFRKEREERVAGDESYAKQLEENHQTLQKFQVRVNHALRRCCSKPTSQMSNYAMRNFFKEQSDEFKIWVAENFLRKNDSTIIDEQKIAALILQYTDKSGEDLKILQEELRLYVEENRKELEALKFAVADDGGGKFFSDGGGDGNVSVAFIRKLIADAIKLYDADKTGKVDYALESGGGHVQSIRCTETYIATTKSYIWMGWTIYTLYSSPRDAINPGMFPGQCWAFVGSQGYLVLQLSHTIVVSGFTMEHISKLLVPSGHIESAPKSFSMWGLKDENDLEPYLFGEYTYLDNDETVQYFPVANPTDVPYKFVELKIMSNHGNPDYTCLYRIRVHGKVASVQF